MTAQIAIMNKNAVALATDSAVTSSSSRGAKVYNTANKLFTPSKYHPVGVMIHANSEFMGYPWETLIKAYRESLGRKSFAKLTDYAASFFVYIESQEAIFPATVQENWLSGQIRLLVGFLNQRFNESVRAHIDQHGSIDEPNVIALFEARLADIESGIYAVAPLNMYVEHEEKAKFTNAAAPIVDMVIEEVLQSLPLADLKDRVREALLYKMMSDSGQGYTGIVFAGFGHEELLPVVDSYWVDARFADVLRRAHYPRLSNNMNTSQGASIIPFAQSDTVYRFLQGIDPSYKRDSLAHIDALIQHIRDHLEACLDEEASKAINQSLDNLIAEKRRLLHEQLGSIESERFLDPVLDVIASLPKDDLAAIAESLVNLTSFQRKIVREIESVGGPIDVAVISKGDGFIWIRRKHYFQRELNPAFFANYFKGESSDGE